MNYFCLCRFLVDCENRLKIVKIYKARMEMAATVIIGQLTHCGKVFTFRCNKVTDTIYNGVCTACMRVNSKIPSNIFIAGEAIHAWYPSQPKMCQRCGSEDHLAANCHTEKCFNCEARGHRAEDCTKPMLCGICMESRSCFPKIHSKLILANAPSSPEKDDLATIKALHIARQPTASAVHPLQPSDDNSPCESSFLKTFLRAIKKPSPE